jgi:hypothetical protein
MWGSNAKKKRNMIKEGGRMTSGKGVEYRDTK